MVFYVTFFQENENMKIYFVSSLFCIIFFQKSSRETDKQGVEEKWVWKKPQL